MKPTHHEIFARDILMPAMRILLTLVVSLCSFALARTGNAVEVETVFRGIAHDALYAIEFQDQYGISIGASGLILTSEDAGQTWARSHSGLTESAILDVSLTPEHGIMVGQQGLVIVREKNSEWRVIDSITDNRLMAVDLKESGLAVTVGGFGAVLISRDSGNTWQPLSIDWEAILDDFIEPHLYDVHITPDNRIYIVGEFELVLRSMDLGRNWEVLHKGESSLFALSMLDSGEAIAVGQKGTVLKAMGSDEDWRKLTPVTTENLLGVWHDRPGRVLVSGIRSMIHSNDYGQTWHSIEAGDIGIGWYQGIAVNSESRVDESGLPLNKLFSVGHTGIVKEITL